MVSNNVCFIFTKDASPYNDRFRENNQIIYSGQKRCTIHDKLFNLSSNTMFCICVLTKNNGWRFLGKGKVVNQIDKRHNEQMPTWLIRYNPNDSDVKLLNDALKALNKNYIKKADICHIHPSYKPLKNNYTSVGIVEMITRS